MINFIASSGFSAMTPIADVPIADWTQAVPRAPPTMAIPAASAVAAAVPSNNTILFSS
jgi:hypothetical protein